MLQRYRLEVVKSPRITLLIPERRSLFFAFLGIILKNQKEKETRQYRTSTCYGTGGTQKRERLGDKSAASLHQQLQYYTIYKVDSILIFFSSFSFLSPYGNKSLPRQSFFAVFFFVEPFSLLETIVQLRIRTRGEEVAVRFKECVLSLSAIRFYHT